MRRSVVIGGVRWWSCGDLAAICVNRRVAVRASYERRRVVGSDRGWTAPPMELIRYSGMTPNCTIILNMKCSVLFLYITDILFNCTITRVIESITSN